MRQDVHPIAAFLVVSIAISLISMIIWARGEALRVGGPDQVQRDPQGNIYISISGSLYRFSPQFELLKEIQLEKLGVHALVGDFAFFSNGDMLIRRGKYEPGLLESILRYMRLPTGREPVARQEGEGLYRCRLESLECLPFGTHKTDFNSAFHLSIAVDSNTVFLSDTGRHKLRKFDAEGNELAVRGKGFKFPNQNLLYQGKLLVADTNHHAIQEVASGDDDFGTILRTHVVRNAALGGKRWTYSFARVGERWWVNNMGGNMSHGTVAVFDDQWRFLQEIQLPDGADPIDIGVFQDRVLITDLDNITIHQLDKDGKMLQASLPGPIEEKLTVLAKSRNDYFQLAYFGIALFVVFLIAGFVVAIHQGRSQREPKLQLSAQERAFRLSDPNIQWIEKNKSRIRLLKIAVYMPIPIMLLLLVALMSVRDSLPAYMPYWELVMVFAVFAMTPMLLRKTLAMELGVLGQLLVIKMGEEYAVGTEKNIFYSDHYILIGRLFVPLNQQNMIFDTRQVIQKVMPLLQGASYIKPGQMTNMILRRLKLSALITNFLAAVLFVGTALWLVYR